MRLAVFRDLYLFGFQVGNYLPILIGDDGINLNQVASDADNVVLVGFLRLLRLGCLLCRWRWFERRSAGLLSKDARGEIRYQDDRE